MRERPILFSGPMVSAILNGTKYQTRRPVKPQPRDIDGMPILEWPVAATDPAAVRFCPFGAPGDRLWVRETFAQNVPGCERGLSYRADHRDPRGDGPANPMRWRPSIHMPRWASRLTLEVTDVRVRRVADIGEADARAEGFGAGEDGRFANPTAAARENATEHVHNARQAFLLAWRSIYGHGNPWVWAITFRRVP